MANVVLDASKLKEIATANDTAVITAQVLQERERNRPTSDITRTRSAMVRKGKKIVEADYVQFWKDLQSAGVGSIVYGRRGKPDRFEWHFSLKEIGKAMFDGSNEKLVLTQEREPVAKQKIEPTPAKKSNSKVEKIYISLDEPEESKALEFILPSGGRVEMKIPDEKMSEAEIDGVVREFRKLALSL